jgi:hypothetical protein
VSTIRATVDLDDTEALISADRDGLLRSASMAGAQVRATAAAVDEGALDPVRGDQRPRSLIWVAGRGTAEAAGTMLSATLGTSAVEPVVVTAEVPPWIGPLDVLVVAGDDPADPALVGAAATAVRRSARVVVAAPYDGPLRDATAGRAAVLAPRLWVPDEFGLGRYLAVGLATMHAVDSALPADLAALADDLDAEALRNSAGRELFTNAAKSLAERMTGRGVALSGDNAATLALARHAAVMFLRIAGHPVAATGLADALVAMRSVPQHSGGPAGVDSLFHDEEIDGPLPERLRVLALTLAGERQVVSARVAGIADVDLVGVQDVPDMLEDASGSATAARALGAGRPEQQLATLAVRLEMAAVYLRLIQG